MHFELSHALSFLAFGLIYGLGFGLAFKPRQIVMVGFSVLFGLLWIGMNAAGGTPGNLINVIMVFPASYLGCLLGRWLRAQFPVRQAE